MAEAGAEKAINYDDLKAGTPKWSLHDDHALLKTLQTMSTNLHVQTKKLEDNVSDLVNESTSTDVRLQNTFNEFLSLANTQFIENRVYQGATWSAVRLDRARVPPPVALLSF